MVRESKKWSLLSNTFDKALIRNQIGVQFHHKVMEANQEYQYTSECEPFDFYLDGHYMGSYLLLESVEAGSTRVDIDAENPDNHDILLELDMTDRDAGKDAHLDAHTTLMNVGFTINEPEGPGTDAANPNNEDHQEWLEFNETYAAKKTYTLNYLNNLESKIQNGGNGTLDEIGELIDIDSFVNYYITVELFRITDVSFSSVRFFIKKSSEGIEKLYAGPLWDLDLSSGNAEGAAANPDNDMHAQNNPWFGALMKNKEFSARVTERFNEVLPEINKLVAENGTIDTVVNTLRKSIDANYSDLAYNQFSVDAKGVNTGWGIDKLYTAGHHECATADEARATGNVSGSLKIYNNYDGYLNDFKSYMTGRIKYLKKQFDATDYEEVLTDIGDQMGSYAYNLAKKKKAVIYKNYHNEGKIEYLNDGELTNGYLALTNAETSSAWGNENGEPVYATIDLGKYYKAESIDKVVVQYKDGQENDTVLNKAYRIQYSIDGKNFRDVASADKAVLDADNRTIDDVSGVSGTVRYVRLYFPKQAGYGMQIREFAVLDTDKNAETVGNNNYNIAFGTDSTYSSWKEGINNSKAITDGIINNHDNYVGIHVDGAHNNTGYYQINLNETVSVSAIDEVVVWYRDGRNNLAPTDIGYTIQYSDDGDRFYNVKIVTANEMPSENKNQDALPYVTIADMSDIVSDVRTVKAIRVLYNGNVGWGIQAREIAVLDKTGNAGADREQIDVDAPEMTAVSDTYNTIRVTIAEVTGQENYTYTIAIDGKQVEKDVKAGVYTFTDVEEGEHTVSVRANYNGGSSQSVSIQVYVQSAFTFTQDALAGRVLPDVNENGNNYLRYTGIKAEASSGDASLAIDNNADTRWESLSSDPQEIIVNLGAVYSVKEIAAVWENAAAKDYTVQTSTDGQNYVTAAIIKDQSEVANRYDRIVLTDAVEARFIKIHGTARVTGYGHSIWEIAVYGADEQKEYVPILSPASNLSVISYAKYTGKYILAFEPGELAESYNVYIDDVFVKNIKGAGHYLTSQDVEGVALGEHDIMVKAVGTEGQETEGTTAKITIEDAVKDYNDIPQIYISTGGRDISGTYFAKQPGGKANVGITIADNTGNNKDVVDFASDIKIRGNSTAGAEKKPYNFKLSKKQELLGMKGKAKKWSLLANAFDKALIRNALVMQLATTMGLDYTSECRFVDIYINGTYSGNYLLIESVETGSGRIEINDPEEITNNDVVLEVDNNGRDAAETFHLERSGLGILFMLGEPEFGSDETDKIALYQDKIINTQNLIANFEEALKKDDYEEASKYVDMDSFAKFYLVNEIFRNNDFNFSSTRFYVKDNIMYGGPCWDYDLSSGNLGEYYSGEYKDGVTYNSFKAQELVWYNYLMKNEKFKNLVVKYYNQYLPYIQAIYDGSKADEGFGIDAFVKQYRNSFERNYISKEQLGAGWSITNPDMADAYSYANFREWNTYDDSVEFLRDWLQNRDNWLREQWDISGNLISQDVGITGYQISTSLDGATDDVGIRTVYQRENLVEGQEVSEFGMVIGLADGITDADKEMIVDGSSEFVVSYQATEAGKSEVQMGDSKTALYYVRTMDIAGGYNIDYHVRAYAKLSDGSVVYSEVKIEGYQMSSNMGGEEGKLGLRVVYSVEGEYEELGLIYGLVYGNTPITSEDLVIDNDSTYVKTYAATETGKLNAQLGLSKTAQYYARTMNVGGLNKTGYTISYLVRAYAKTSDGNIVYSDVYSYSIHDVASALYDNDLMSTAVGHNAIYTKILTKVNPAYKEVDYAWSNTMIK